MEEMEKTPPPMGQESSPSQTLEIMDDTDDDE